VRGFLAVTDPLIGKRLDEYRLEKLLGRGGMARVYRGLDLGLQRYAAVKVIDTPYRQDEDYLARFEREARAIAQLEHPHIVTVYRYGRASNLLYLAMRYIEGPDLQIILEDYEQKGQIMSLADVTRLIREIGSALDYAHRQGIIHRDVKPSNVMLNAEGRAYLTDFGMALLTDVGTQGKILGSPHYISPEQAVSSARAVPQSDLYSLGVILFRMVTGRLPFNHDDMLELLMLHMTVEPPDPRDIRPDVDSALAEVILKALVKEPDKRYTSGKALSDALEAAVKDTAPAPFAAPTLSIVDRVALDKEMLPQISAVVTSESGTSRSTLPLRRPAVLTDEPDASNQAPQPADKPPRTSKLTGFLKLTVVAVFFLLVALAAVYLFRFPETIEQLPSIIRR
jgi:serine/threonine protein kinase